MVQLPVHRPALMGILNVTPDSFSDGGLHLDPARAIEAGLRMLGEGADILDVGGESTRPGAEPIPEDEEIRRVLSVVEALTGNGATVSIDTMKPEVAQQAISSGASIVNDVSGLRNPEMRQVCALAGCTVCIMHMLGEPRTMQQAPHYPRGVVIEVREWLSSAAGAAEKNGIERESIWLDPGIGFGKTLEHNLDLLRNLNRIVELGYPVLVGASRKAFIGRILGSNDVPLPTEERLEGTLAVHVLAQACGAKIIRTHDVKAARRAIDVAAAILGR